MRAATLDLLLGSRRRATAAASAFDSSRSLPVLVETCSEWRVLPQLNQRLTELSVELPAEVRKEFRRLTAQAFLRTSRCVERGAEALDILTRAGIPCAGFKGIAAVAILYRGLRDRTLLDVDILIRKEDLGKALSELRRGGFMSAISGSLEDYMAFVRNSPGFAGNEAIALADASGGSIDLHWRLGQLDTEMLLAGTQAVPLFGRSIRVVQGSHCMTVAAHHALRNNFVPDEMIRDLLDFRDWLPWVEEHGAPPEAKEFAKQNGLLGPLLALAQLVESFGEMRAAFAQSAPAADRRVAADLAELYRSQLEEGLLNADLVYLANLKSIRQIVAGAASGWSRYRAHMRAFEQSNGRAPVALGLRLRKLAVGAWRLPFRRWRLVRTLVTVKNAGSRWASASDDSLAIRARRRS
jgi:hypothetical protein